MTFADENRLTDLKWKSSKGRCARWLLVKRLSNFRSIGPSAQLNCNLLAGRMCEARFVTLAERQSIAKWQDRKRVPALCEWIPGLPMRHTVRTFRAK
jgi:hypothetical protein